MRQISSRIGIILCVCVAFSCQEVSPPQAVGPVPSARQLAWQGLEYYAFVHFNMNTFSNMEWGFGDESPQLFNPTALDTGQWAKVAREAGMKGIIITAKHHDGFCLWPTATTEHSVKNSPWKQGKGDLIRELAEACRENGLRFGIYLSPWDRNSADYGTAAYVEAFHEQLRELLSDYGDIFEVWFDGANGGTGYYGGANETRNVDNKTYYQWEKVTDIVRELQPNAVIFSDGGPDIRWVGNEEGWADETNWSIMRRDEIYPGWPRYLELRTGHEDGTHWLPAEADVSIRPGWYYHPSEDHQVKNLPQLLDIYYYSVGRNASLLLNLPVDPRGVVHEEDVKQLVALRKQLDADFGTDLAPGAETSASNVRGNSDRYAASMVNDWDPGTYWATDDGVSEASIMLKFNIPTPLNRIVLQEYIPLGQRVQQFSVAAEVDGKWKKLDEQTTIGYKRILRFETVTATAIRLEIAEAKGPPLISAIGLYQAPVLLYPPKITRDRQGMVSLEVTDGEAAVYYTLDGGEPTPKSLRYQGPFKLDRKAMVRAMAYSIPESKGSETVSKTFDISRTNWAVRFPVEENSELQKMIDEDPETYWTPEKGKGKGREVVIDLGEEYSLKGFTYWPMQGRWPFGIFTGYEFMTSTDSRNWLLAAQGEFSNIVNNPIEQIVHFKARPARFIKLKALNVQGEDPRASYGDIGVLTGRE